MLQTLFYFTQTPSRCHGDDQQEEEEMQKVEGQTSYQTIWCMYGITGFHYSSLYGWNLVFFFFLIPNKEKGRFKADFSRNLFGHEKIYKIIFLVLYRGGLWIFMLDDECENIAKEGWSADGCGKAYSNVWEYKKMGRKRVKERTSHLTNKINITFIYLSPRKPTINNLTLHIISR